MTLVGIIIQHFNMLCMQLYYSFHDSLGQPGLVLCTTGHFSVRINGPTWWDIEKDPDPLL